MDAIILVGGRGTRLRSVVSDRPKPLAEVNGIPFLDYLLAQIEEHVSRVILAVGYLGDQVALQYKNRCLISTEAEPLGTGGAVRQALDLVEGDRFWVLNGDSFFDISFAEMEKCRGDAVIACRLVEDVSRYGSIQMDGSRIISFEEKKASSGAGWINGGIYTMTKALFDESVSRGPFSLEMDLFPSLLLSNKVVSAYPVSGTFIDIGTPESYTQASGLLAKEEIALGER